MGRISFVVNLSKKQKRWSSKGIIMKFVVILLQRFPITEQRNKFTVLKNLKNAVSKNQILIFLESFKAF